MASCADFAALRASPSDVRVVASDGSSIAAHSSVLAAASPVLEQMILDARRGWDAGCTVVRVLGAPSDAVAAFLRFLYRGPGAGGTPAAAEEEEEWAEGAVGAHGAALLALAHAYRVPWLKRRAEAGAAARLTAERAVDALKLAALCDAPRLYLACARLAGKDLATVERSEGWRFAARHDAALLGELLQLLHDADQQPEGQDAGRGSGQDMEASGEEGDQG
ncbi:hypothetical protein PVAP13_1NG330400 [Panicum virgatum]|uniref:BTB domain-containing protein n=1 Tax=Panicum virgatum TaxID=38727 RepID=A0A8T0X405_PANVG|nr:hypothetical protein PVAP13_1NG330400 [Panicum virgatum]